MKRPLGIFFLLALLALSLIEARIQSEERILQYQVSPRKLTNCF